MKKTFIAMLFIFISFSFFAEEKSLSVFYIDVQVGKKESCAKNKKCFSDLYEACSFIEKQSKDCKAKTLWQLNVCSNFTIDEVIFVNANLRIIGNDNTLTFKTNSAFVVYKGNVSFENVVFTREEAPSEPRCVPIIYAQNSKITLNTVKFQTKNDSSSVRLFRSEAFFKNLQYKSEQEQYTECFTLSESKLIIDTMNFELQCKSALAFLLDKSTASFKNTSFELKSELDSKILEVKNSELTLQDFKAKNSSAKYTKNICISHDKKSKIISHSVCIKGFIDE